MGSSYALGTSACSHSFQTIAYTHLLPRRVREQQICKTRRFPITSLQPSSLGEITPPLSSSSTVPFLYNTSLQDRGLLIIITSVVVYSFIHHHILVPHLHRQGFRPRARAARIRREPNSLAVLRLGLHYFLRLTLSLLVQRAGRTYLSISRFHRHFLLLLLLLYEKEKDETKTCDDDDGCVKHA